MSRHRRLAGAFNVATWVVVSATACGGVVRVEGGSQDAGSTGGLFSTGTGGSGPVGPGGGSSRRPGSGGSATSSGGFVNGGGAFTSAGGAFTSSGGASTWDAGGPAVYSCVDPPPDPAGFAQYGDPCCTSSFGFLGVCAASSLLPSERLQADRQHDACTAGLECEPNSLPSVTGGLVQPVYQHCQASLGVNLTLEGRCAPTCFISRDPEARLFRQDDCSSAELACMPCFDPIDGSATGVCSQLQGDAPVEPPPTPFPSCGEVDGGPKSGTCVPPSLAKALPFQLSISDSCPSPTDVCVPTSRATHPGSCFARCATGLGDIYDPGACVPSFVARDWGGEAALALFFPCSDPNEVCAPCLDPLHGGTSSHLCE